MWRYSLEDARPLLRQGLHKARFAGGATALHLVENPDVAYALIKAGAKLDATDNFDDTPLIIAIENNRHDIAKMLIRAGANVNLGCKVPAIRNNCLLNAIYLGQYELVRALIKAGADLEVSARGADSVLHLAAWTGCAEIVALLLEEGGISPRVTNAQGQTPLDLAPNAETYRLLYSRYDQGRIIQPGRRGFWAWLKKLWR